MPTGFESSRDALLADLNEPQREAVTHAEGPLLILAGPGSGKTRVVTRRAAYLAASVTEPWHILAITFTNKAAREMQERMRALSIPDGLTVCTFHAFCVKLLHQYHERAGVSRNFTIFDRDDRRKLIKQAVEACNLSSSNWSPAAVDQEIGRAKNVMLTVEDYSREAVDWHARTIARIYVEYESLLRKMDGLDFDDLLMRAALLLRRDNDLCDILGDRFRYVLVDEYQDTNAAQYCIAQHLTRKSQNICATGDPDQSIYGWRGADIENILRFERDFPDAKVIRLEQNYRSTKRILATADALITGNVNRKQKTLWTANDTGLPVRVIECENGESEAEWVANDIVQATRNGTSPRDVAVFYRVNSLSRVIEEALIRAGVAYQVARGVEFYNRKEIKDVLAYLRVLVNPADEVALLRIINTPPRGIGATTIERLRDQASAGGVSVHTLIRGEGDLSALGRSANKVREFGTLLDGLRPVLEKPAPEALKLVLSHSGLQAHYSAAETGEDAPAANLDELVNAAAEFAIDLPEATIRDWLEYTALLGDTDSIDEAAGKVTLMTLHAAKGLEFPVVHIVGLEEGLIPFLRREDDDYDDEEERRLLFVGMTRAERRLTLCHARYRMRRGVTERTIRSPFLDELPRDGVEWQAIEMPTRAREVRPTGRLPDDIEQWSIGTVVRHPVHGLGRIMSMHRGAKRTHVDVLFTDGLRRSWVLEFAKLTRVDFDEIGDMPETLGV